MMNIALVEHRSAITFAIRVSKLCSTERWDRSGLGLGKLESAKHCLSMGCRRGGRSAHAHIKLERHISIYWDLNVET